MRAATTFPGFKKNWLQKMTIGTLVGGKQNRFDNYCSCHCCRKWVDQVGKEVKI